MTFQFTEGFDYYPLFEAAMMDSDWQEMANDAEDYDEFVQALKDGTFVPKN